MAAVQEKIHPHPTDKDAVIREIIPGGHQERRYLQYDNELSARLVQRLHRSRFFPNFLVALADDGVEVDGSCLELDAYPTDEFDIAGTPSEEQVTHDSVAPWHDDQEETHYAA